MMYALDNNDIGTFEKYMNEISKKYKDPIIITLSKLFVTKDLNEKQLLTGKILELLKNENDRKRVGVSDEECYFMKRRCFWSGRLCRSRASIRPLSK